MYAFFIDNNQGIVSQSIQNEDLVEYMDIEVKTFFRECGGQTIKRGLYRTHTPASSFFWTIIIGNYFSLRNEKIIPFGYDWMGRQFAINTTKKGLVLMFDAATAEYFELQQDIVSFHNQELVYEREAILSELLFHEALSCFSVGEIKYRDCVGYKVPLFLGGVDNITNYEIADMDVYWEIQRQIYQQVKDLPPGTNISSIKIE